MNKPTPPNTLQDPDPSPYTSTKAEVLQAVRENSIRRGVFFLKNLTALNLDAIIAQVEHLAMTYDMEAWREASAEAGIMPEALDILDGYNPPVPYPYYFCLPNDLIATPQLVLYYRNVTMVSNKVMKNIGLDTTQYEVGVPPEADKATQIAQHLNQITSSLVLQTPLFGKRRHIEMTYSNIGASLDGSWRNEVGRLAYTTLITPLIAHLHQRGKLQSITYRLKGRIALADEDKESDKEKTTEVAGLCLDDLTALLSGLEERRVVYRRLDMINGNQVLLNRQLYWHNPDTPGRGARIGPDLITEAAQGDQEVYPWAGELKGGADPAGSDEHWKTATQAFNRIIDAAKQTGRPQPMLSFLATILVDRVAKEAELWLQQGKLTSVHNLTRIANDPNLQQAFLDQMTAFFEAKSAKQ